MSGIPSLPPTGAARSDRATLAIAKALQEKKREAEGMVRLIDGASVSGKGQLVDYKA